MSDTLTAVSLATLAALRRAVEREALIVPLTPLDLRARGLDAETADRLVRVLGGLGQGPLLAILGTLIAERERAEERRPRLLWSGPEATGTAALDTRVQLTKLLRGARKSVFVAGYVFDDPTLLRPLVESMAAHQLDVTIVLDIRAEGDGGRDQRIQDQVRAFLEEVWKADDLRPRIFVDPRTAAWNPKPESDRGGYYVSMHAKAVVVDDEHCIVGSANFTGRATDRNIEAGVLIRNPDFARTLLRQWEALIASGVLQRVKGSAQPSSKTL